MSLKPSPSPAMYSSPNSGVALDLLYFKTGPGIVKLIELLWGIFVMACTAPTWEIDWSGSDWFLFVAVAAFVATILWCFIYLLSLKNVVQLPIDWLLTELVNTSLTTLLYLIAVIVQFCSIPVGLAHDLCVYPQTCHAGRNIAGGIFGIFAVVTYAAGSFFLYRDWKANHPNSSLMHGIKRNPTTV